MYGAKATVIIFLFIKQDNASSSPLFLHGQNAAKSVQMGKLAKQENREEKHFVDPKW